MKPVSPVYPGFEQYEVNIGEGQPEYFPIPAIVTDDEKRRCISRWEFSEEERKQIAEGGTLVFQQLTFGQKFQPIAMYIEPKVHFSDKEKSNDLVES